MCGNNNYLPLWPCNLLWIRVEFGDMEREALHSQACKLVGQPNKFRFTPEVTSANSNTSLHNVWTILLFQWLF